MGCGGSKPPKKAEPAPKAAEPKPVDADAVGVERKISQTGAESYAPIDGLGESGETGDP